MNPINQYTFPSLRTVLLHIVLLLIIQSSFGQSLKSKELEANKVLSRIYNAASYPVTQKPRLKLIQSKHFGAAYIPSLHQIQLEEQLFDLCKKIKPTGQDALAFVIAHELSHAFQKFSNANRIPSNLFMEGHKDSKVLKEEQEADISAVFLCYLAGYHPSEILSPLIDNMYKTYNISEQNSAYPPKEIRISSMDTVIARSNGLIQLFESANLLLIQEEYQLAELCYRHLMQQNKGPEVYNNLGLIYIYKAMAYYQHSTDQYIYPLELDVNSGLKKIQISRGDLSEEDMTIRKFHLLKAKEYFETAESFNKQYVPSKINKLACLNLLGNSADALMYGKSIQSNISKKHILHNSYQMVMAICLAHSQPSKSQVLFERIVLVGNLKESHHANYNKNVLQQCLKVKSKSTECSIPELQSHNFPARTITAVKHNVSIGSGNQTVLFGYQRNADQYVYSFESLYGSKLIISRKKHEASTLKSLKHVLDQAIGHQEIALATTYNGNYIKCNGSDIIYLLDQTGNIQEEIEFLN